MIANPFPAGLSGGIRHDMLVWSAALQPPEDMRHGETQNLAQFLPEEEMADLKERMVLLYPISQPSYENEGEFLACLRQFRDATQNKPDWQGFYQAHRLELEEAESYARALAMLRTLGDKGLIVYEARNPRQPTLTLKDGGDENNCIAHARAVKQVAQHFNLLQEHFSAPLTREPRGSEIFLRGPAAEGFRELLEQQGINIVSPSASLAR